MSVEVWCFLWNFKASPLEHLLEQNKEHTAINMLPYKNTISHERMFVVKPHKLGQWVMRYDLSISYMSQILF